MSNALKYMWKLNILFFYAMLLIDSNLPCWPKIFCFYKFCFKTTIKISNYDSIKLLELFDLLSYQFISLYLPPFPPPALLQGCAG